MAKRGVPTGRCTVCAHPERARIDWLLASGQSVRAVAAQFGLGYDAIWRHGRNHISEQFKRSVKLSAELSEEELRKQLARDGVSVLQQSNAIFAGLYSRYVLALEAGDDHRVSIISKELHSNMRLRAQLNHELAPSGSSSVTINNVVFSPGWLEDFGRELIAIGNDFPEVRPRLLAMLRRRMGAEPEAQPEKVRVLEDHSHA